MCPVKLQEGGGLEVSTAREDWGECSKRCHLTHYTSNTQIYDEVIKWMHRIVLTVFVYKDSGAQ